MNTPTEQLIREIASGFHEMPLTDAQAAGLTELVGALRAEMQPMLQLDVGELEPATVYHAATAVSPHAAGQKPATDRKPEQKVQP